MPELPEVEVVARELDAKIVGRRLTEIIEYTPRSLKAKPALILGRLGASKILRVYRKAKYIFCQFENGEHLVSHLRMTGKFVFQSQNAMPHKHDRIGFVLDNGEKVMFNDSRRFGTIEIVHEKEFPEKFKKLGLEPFDDEFNASSLAKLTKKSKQSTKLFLMDQSKIAGLGNIYASEILFRSKIHPQKIVNSLSTAKIKKLTSAIKETLTEALSKNGTTISDYRRVDDKTGEFQNFLNVYARADKECKTCGKPIKKIIQGQRSTFFCPSCQKL